MSNRRQAASHREPVGRQNEYFLPAEGISREVIQADICRYLGNDALVRRGVLEGRDGYLIRAYRSLTTQMIADVKADSERWEAESSRRTMRGQAPVAYERTGIHDDRQRHGPTTQAQALPGGYLTGQPQYMSQQDYASHDQYEHPQMSQYGQPQPGGRADYGATAEPGYAYQSSSTYSQSQQRVAYDYPSRDGYDPRNPRDPRDREPREATTTAYGYESSLASARPTPPAGYTTQEQYPSSVSHGQSTQMPSQYGANADPSPVSRHQPDPYARGDPRYGTAPTQPGTDDTPGVSMATAPPTQMPSQYGSYADPSLISRSQPNPHARGDPRHDGAPRGIAARRR